MLSDEAICAVCEGEFFPVDRAAPIDVDSFRILFHYTRRAGQAVRNLKYRRATSLAEPMAGKLRAEFDQWFSGEVDFVIPVPIHWSRRFERGFNQSELLTSKMPEEVVASSCLRRIRATKPQASLSPTERLTSLQGAFQASPQVAGKHVLLVDDVVTSGTTANECAAALRAAGAAAVHLLAFAGSP